MILDKAMREVLQFMQQKIEAKRKLCGIDTDNCACADYNKALDDIQEIIDEL